MSRLTLLLAILFIVGCAEDTSSPSMDSAPDDNANKGPSGKADAPNSESVSGGDEFQPVYPLEGVEFPESGVYDALEHAFYVGSLETGGVWRVDAQTGNTMSIYEEERAGEWWTLGLDIDPERRTLWACSMEDLREVEGEEVDNRGYILKIDLYSGELVKRFDLSETFPDAACADVAIDATGAAFVVDRTHPHVYKIGLDDEVEIFAADPKLEGGVVGQNAVVVLPDQSALLTIVYMRPRLVRVDLKDGSVTQVDLDGDFFDHFPPLAGADGMTVSGEEVLVIFTSELMRITPDDASWESARSDSMDIRGGHTDIIHTPHGDYMLNGQALGFAFGGEIDPFSLTLAPAFEE